MTCCDVLLFAFLRSNDISLGFLSHVLFLPCLMSVDRCLTLLVALIPSGGMLMTTESAYLQQGFNKKQTPCHIHSRALIRGKLIAVNSLNQMSKGL